MHRERLAAAALRRSMWILVLLCLMSILFRINYRHQSEFRIGMEDGGCIFVIPCGNFAVPRIESLLSPRYGISLEKNSNLIKKAIALPVIGGYSIAKFDEDQSRMSAAKRESKLGWKSMSYWGHSNFPPMIAPKTQPPISVFAIRLPILWIIMLSSFSILSHYCVMRYRTNHHLCLTCGYCLESNISGYCPECGSEVCNAGHLATPQAKH
jgi:hypothetical protein